jgi:hypothetical protein
MKPPREVKGHRRRAEPGGRFLTARPGRRKTEVGNATWSGFRVYPGPETLHSSYSITQVRVGMFRTILLSLPLSLLLVLPAAGQIRIVGRVIDDFTELPIAEARVILRTRDGAVLGESHTNQTGTFEFEIRSRAPGVRIQAMRLGYETSTTPVLYFDRRTFFQIEVRLDPDAILLAPLEVIAWSERPEDAMLEGFRRRLGNGLGTYITREDVEKRNPALVTDLLRDVPGLLVSGSGTGTRPVVRVQRAAGMALLTPGDCMTQIFVDGFLVNRRMIGMNGARPSDFRIDDVVSPVSVEGIEIYKGLGTVPAEFLNPDAKCGVIAIWTRRGGPGY